MTRLLDYSNLRSGLLLPRLPLCWLWADDSKRGGCMYLTLLCSYLLYNTTTKGTVYVHTQARMRGDAVPLAVRTTPYLATSSPSSTPSLSSRGSGQAGGISVPFAS